MRLIDTHCHLNDREAFPNPAEAVQLAKDAGVDRLIVVGVDLESSRYAVEIAEAHAGVYAIVGWHPNYTQHFNSGEFKEITQLFESSKVIALGEIGLDYHWDYATREQQFLALEEQIEFAESEGKRVVFHCREAYPDLLSFLEPRKRVPYLFHCFAGSTGDAERALSLGSKFGVDGPVTYKKADELRATLAAIGIDHLMLETDSPWMSPHPFRSERNHPAKLGLINEGLAACLGILPEECAEITTANAEEFFCLSAG